jgi:hypothetical protein
MFEQSASRAAAGLTGVIGLALGATALPINSAQAALEVIHPDQSIDISVNPTGAQFGFGGTTFDITSNPLSPATLFIGTSNPSLNGSFTAASSAKGTAIMPLAVGTTVDSSLAFATTADANKNPTLPVNATYIGLQSADGDFGWVLINDNMVETVAFNTTAGVGVVVGQVPEPASLAILAMGAVGLAGVRRRRRAA